MGILKSIGNALNKITGTSASARQQYESQMALQKDAQAFSQWQMGNAHQMEVQDLQNAGLNPVLSAGGSGANAGVTEGSASTGNSSGIDMLGFMLNTAKTISDIEKQDAETKNIDANTAGQTQQQQWNPAIWTAGIELQNATSAKTRAEKEKILAEKVETETRIKLNTIKAEMAGMDKEKREKFFSEEVEIMRQQMITLATDAGFNNTTMGIVLRAIGKGVDAMSPLTNSLGHGGNTYNFTQSAPTVNY